MRASVCCSLSVIGHPDRNKARGQGERFRSYKGIAIDGVLDGSTSFLEKGSLNGPNWFVKYSYLGEDLRGTNH